MDLARRISSFFDSFDVDRKVLYVVVGSAGAAVLGSVLYVIYKRRRSSREVKTYPFKIIRAPTPVTGLESKRTVAVLGATGFVGSHTVEALIENGQHRVYMLGRRFNDRNINPKADAVYQVDMMNYESMERAFEGVDTVISSAINIPNVYSTADEVRRRTIAGAQNVLNAAKNTGVKNLILISGIKYVQEHKNAEARALITAIEHIEEMFLRVNRHNNVHSCVLSFGGQIYGTNSPLYQSVVKGELPYTALMEYRASFLPVETVTEAIIKAEQKLSEGDNLVAGNNLCIAGAPSTYREWFTHPNFGVRIKHVPVFLMDTVAKVNRFVARLTGFAPFGIAMSPAMTSFFQVDEQVYDPQIPREALGIDEIPPIDQGIARMMAKFRAKGVIS